MTIRKLVLLCLALILVPRVASGQERNGAGKVEIDSALLGGGLLILPSGLQPRGYVLDIGLAYNVKRQFGFEGDFTWAMSHSQTTSLTGPAPTEEQTPNMLFYTGNVMYNPFGHDRPLIPYLEVGGGAVSVVGSSANFGLASTTHLAANLGGGIRWYIMPHWGARADYRYIAIQNNNAPAILGVAPIHHAQRLYGALVVTF